MNTQHEFEPQARAALHCEALLAHRLTDKDRLAGLARLAGEWSSRAAEGLAALAGRPPGIALDEPVFAAPAAFAAQVDRAGAAHRLLALGAAEQALHVTVFGDGIDAAVSRLFGGAPESAAPAGRKEPRTSTAIVQQRIAAAWQDALGGLLEPAGVAVRSLDRPGLAGHMPGARGDVAVLAAAIEGLGPEPLRVQIGMRLPALAVLAAAQRTRSGSGAAARQPASAPFGDIPLPLRAVLADARVPLARLAALQVGETLALPLNRRVPLKCGDSVIAWGAVGELDDCAALRVTELPTMGSSR